jgi:hypothetical protein
MYMLQTGGSKMKRLFVSLVLVLSIVCISPQSYAAPGIGSLISTSLLGTSIGILVGATTLVFMNNPSDHQERVYRSAAIGFACGFGLGLYGMISPTYTESRTHQGQKEKVWGLQIRIPLE